MAWRQPPEPVLRLVFEAHVWDDVENVPFLVRQMHEVAQERKTVGFNAYSLYYFPDTIDPRGPGSLSVRLDDVTVGEAAVEWVAEQWQFFAFVFAAAVALALSVLDQSAWPESRPARVGVRFVVFVLLGYVVLVNRPCMRLLPAFSEYGSGFEHPRRWHPWLRVQRLLRDMLRTKWDEGAWKPIGPEIRNALAVQRARSEREPVAARHRGRRCPAVPRPRRSLARNPSQLLR